MHTMLYKKLDITCPKCEGGDVEVEIRIYQKKHLSGMLNCTNYYCQGPFVSELAGKFGKFVQFNGPKKVILDDEPNIHLL